MGAQNLAKTRVVTMGWPAAMNSASASHTRLMSVLSEGFPWPDESSARITTPLHVRETFEASRFAFTDEFLVVGHTRCRTRLRDVANLHGLQITVGAELRDTALEILVDAPTLTRSRNKR
jgi:hypothetical protein